MKPDMSPLSEYRDAIAQGDLTRAARQWQAASQSPHAEEFRREFDFSQVQDFSLAWHTGDLTVLDAVGTQAVAQPQSPLPRFLGKVVSSEVESVGTAHPEVMDADMVIPPTTKAVVDRGKRFVEGLLALGSKKGVDRRAFVTRFNQDPTNRPSEDPVSNPQTTKPKTSKTTQDPFSAQPPAIDPPPRTTLKQVLEFLAQDSIRNRILLNDADMATLAHHHHLEFPTIRAQKDLYHWAKSSEIDLPETSLKQLYRAALLFANRLTAQDASTLAMAARSTRPPKKRSAPPPESPPS